MPFNHGRTETREQISQVDGDQIFNVNEDIEIIQIIPMLPNGLGSTTGSYEIWIKTCTDSEWEPLKSPYTNNIETVDLESPETVLVAAWIERVKISPINIVGEYSLMVKKGYR